MRHRRVVILGGLLLLAAVAVRFSLPPVPLELPPQFAAGVRGAMHVHTRQSDGGGTPEQVAAAAAKAGLQFVILTDHGDGAREPAPPAYHSGVLVVNAVEISAEGGHVGT